MYKRIKAICPFRGSFVVINIFGYASKSFPGVEINGLGKIGKSLKEKFIYVSKELEIKIPVKRVVLCIEEEELLSDLSNDEKAWVELPLFVLFLSLINNINIEKLEDCFTQGKISVIGKITQFELDRDQFSEILRVNKLHHQKFICNKMDTLPEGLKTIELDQLINYPERLMFKNESLETIQLNRLNLSII